MITLLIVVHVTLLSLSLLATMGAVFASALGHVVPKTATVFNIIGTTIGLICGVALLLQAPLDAKCMTLAVYLLAFAGAQVYITGRNHRLAASSDA